MKAASWDSISGGSPASSSSAWLERARSARAEAVAGTPDTRAIRIESRSTSKSRRIRCRSAAAGSPCVGT